MSTDVQKFRKLKKKLINFKSATIESWLTLHNHQWVSLAPLHCRSAADRSADRQDAGGQRHQGGQRRLLRLPGAGQSAGHRARLVPPGQCQVILRVVDVSPCLWDCPLGKTWSDVRWVCPFWYIPPKQHGYGLLLSETTLTGWWKVLFLSFFISPTHCRGRIR